MDNSKILSRLALFACLIAFCVIALGAYTRLIDAGLGCPDWPGCYGKLFTNFESHKAWAEMIHRYAVGGLSILILAIISYVLLNSKLRTKKNVYACIILIALLIYQIILGMFTVTLKLLPVVVSQHLLGGFLILSSLWLVYLINKSQNLSVQSTQKDSLLLGLGVIGIIFIFIQIILGAWTSTNYASLSCPDFPFCINDHIDFDFQFKEAFNLFSSSGINYEGGVLSQSIRQTIQMTHRIGALIVTVYLLLLMMIALPRLRHIPEATNLIYYLMVLLSIQLSLGIINVLFKLPLVTAILHNLTAALILLCTLTFVYKVSTIVRKVYLS